MPTYHYACSSCADEFDKYQSFSEDALTVCPSCQGTIRRVIQPVGVVFKGTGWYLTDSRKAEATNETKATSDDAAPAADGDKAGKADGDKAGKKDKAETTGGKDKDNGAATKSEPAASAKSVESKTATAASS